MYQGQIGQRTPSNIYTFSPKFVKREKGRNNNVSTEEEIRSSFVGYLQNDRLQLDLTLPADEDRKETTEKPSWFGSSFFETIQMNWDFILKRFIVIVYFIVGVAVYEHFEDWSLLNSVYFVIQTVTTIGYGNLVPSSDEAKMFTVFYIFIGILLVFSVMNDVGRRLVYFFRSRYRTPRRLNKFQVFVRHFLNLMMWITIVIFIPIVGGLVFYYNEGWTMEESLYFAAITSTAVGYVDRSLSKNSSIIFNFFYIIISVVLTVIALNKIASFKRHLESAELWQIMEEIPPSKTLVEAVAGKKGLNNRKGVTKEEYILHMLQLEGKLNYETDISRWNTKFQEIDLDKDGYFSFADVETYERGEMRRRTMSQESVSSLASSANKNPVSAFFSGVGNFIYQFYDETKDVILETLGFARVASDTGVSSLTKNDNELRDSEIGMTTVVSPIQRAKSLRDVKITDSQRVSLNDGERQSKSPPS
jgi:hypothetical protein